MGREDEQATINRMLAQARGGASTSLVVRGEPGIGKTALLEQAIASARGMGVLRACGAESEQNLAFAGLHLLLRPVLDRVVALPTLQREALNGAFGLSPARPSDRFLVGLAVLSLLSDLAGDRPLLCVVDDAQWLDHGSATAMLFAARRLQNEGIVMLFAVRDVGESRFLTGLPELRMSGLAPTAATALLDRQQATLPAATRERVLAEALGNPLALIELPIALAAEPAATAALPLTDRLLRAFGDQIRRLPARTRALLLLAACEQGLDLAVLRRAAGGTNSVEQDLTPAEHAGLVRVTDGTVAFRHPLIRAAAYQRAPAAGRLAAHRALAAALHRPEHADRRAWQLAAASPEPDEEVARALEEVAVRAGGRGGYAVSGAAYDRAARLTPGGDGRIRRLGLAAESFAEAGRFDQARTLAGEALGQTGDGVLKARLLRVQAAADFARGALGEANTRLVTGAAVAAGHDARLALELTIEAVHLAWFTDDSGVRPRTAAQVAALRLLPGEADEPSFGLLRGLVSIWSDRGDDVRAFPETVRLAHRSLAADPRSLILVSAAMLVGAQDEELYELAAALVTLGREQGSIGWLPPALSYLTAAQFFLGHPRAARASAEEALRIAIDTDQPLWMGQLNAILAVLAAVSGEEERCRGLAANALDAVAAPNIGGARWALGLLELGAGRAVAALESLEALSQGPERHLAHSTRSIPDLVEAAVRAGEPERAGAPLARLEACAGWAGRPCLDALVLRCRALLATGGAAEKHYLAALDIHDTVQRPYEEARTRLLYGEWLRRAKRKADAGVQLRRAVLGFERLGATPWARRARTELAATGTRGTTRHTPARLDRLTPQESQIVQLAAEGLANRDIAAKLFLSPRTVAHHLYKAYPKLGVGSRRELRAITLEQDI